MIRLLDARWILKIRRSWTGFLKISVTWRRIRKKRTLFTIIHVLYVRMRMYVFMEDLEHWKIIKRRIRRWSLPCVDAWCRNRRSRKRWRQHLSLLMLFLGHIIFLSLQNFYMNVFPEGREYLMFGRKQIRLSKICQVTVSLDLRLELILCLAVIISVATVLFLM